MRVLLLAAVVVVTASRPSEACSLSRTYIAPTNVELVASSPRIVIARAMKSVGDQVSMEVTDVVRGAGVKPGDVFSVGGATTRYMGASKALDFGTARRGAYAGSCVARDYALGKLYVLLLDQFDGVWQPRGVAFARVNEQVDDQDAPWALAVREYARIAALPAPAARRKALQALVTRGSAPNATATDQAIAADVQRHLDAPTPAKSFAELEALEQAGANHTRVLLAIGVGRDPAARAHMRKVVTQLRAATGQAEDLALEAVGAYYAKVSDPAVLGEIADYYVSLGTRNKQTRWPLMSLLIERADASHRAVMERALRTADDEEAGRLGAWFVKFPTPAAEKELLRRIGNSAGGGGTTHRSEITRALAGMGNKAVLAWAQKVVTNKATPSDDDRWVAAYAIAQSPLPEADALVPAIIARGGEDLVSLVQGYGEARHRYAGARLAEIARLPNLDPEVRKWTQRSIESRQKRP